MTIRICLLTICICAGVVLFSPCETYAQEDGVGIVEEVRGTVFLRRNPHSKPRRLDPKLDTARLLYPSEQVRCARGSTLRLLLGQKSRIISATDWFTIPRAVPSWLAPFKRVYADYGRRGGRDRGGEMQVFSPADHSVALVKPFIIRWVPSAADCDFTIMIKDVSDTKVWGKEGVDGAAGSLHDPSAERELIAYRAERGQGPLTLVVNDSCGTMTRLSFSLLSAENEQSLKEDLSFWDKQTGTLVPHIGHASVYNHYRMYSQAAEEYEAARKKAPSSVDLLLRTISAHRATGNFTRVWELKKRLPKGTSIP